VAVEVAEVEVAVVVEVEAEEAVAVEVVVEAEAEEAVAEVSRVASLVVSLVAQLVARQAGEAARREAVVDGLGHSHCTAALLAAVVVSAASLAASGDLDDLGDHGHCEGHDPLRRMRRMTRVKPRRDQ